MPVDTVGMGVGLGVGSAKRTLFGHANDQENVDPKAVSSLADPVSQHLNFEEGEQERLPPSSAKSSQTKPLLGHQEQVVGANGSASAAQRTAQSEASSQQTQARMLASEAKSIEVAVLRLYDSTTTADEIDETIFVNHDENVVFENPLMKLNGVCEVRSLFQLVKKSFWSFNIVRPVKVGLWLGGKDGEGAKLLLDYKIEYQVLPLTPKVVIHQFTHLTINLEGRVIEHRDDWSVSSLIHNIPFVGNVLYPLKQRAMGIVSSSMGGLIQPRASFIYKMLLQN